MDAKLRRRLERMGVTRGLKQSRARPEPELQQDAFPPDVGRSPSSGDLPGAAVETDYGVVWVDRQTYPAAHDHGRYALDALDEVSDDAKLLLGVPDLGARPAFLDTETTGLARGAGTLVFLTGVGIWDGGQFELHQVFLRSPEVETPALRYIAGVLERATGLVTFNGQGFDVPLLETRFVLNRQVPRWLALPHLDLLRVARILWRDHLPSRRLGFLEEHILQVQRTEEDLPSALIPEFYRRYLQTGEAGGLSRIFYHNVVDVLSLASLLVHTARMAETPMQMDLAPAEWAGLGRLYDQAGREEQAFSHWQRALSEGNSALPLACANRLLREMGRRYKRCGMWSQALALWEKWSLWDLTGTEALVEQAKYYEWVVKDLKAALEATELALARVADSPRGSGFLRDKMELDHRKQRLCRKIRNETQRNG